MKITSTQVYRRWFSKLKDETTKARINLRITRLAEGNAGNHRNLTHGISELKLTFGAGYRVYYTQHNDELDLLQKSFFNQLHIVNCSNQIQA